MGFCYSLAELVAHLSDAGLETELRGASAQADGSDCQDCGEHVVTRISPLAEASEGSITFLSDPAYLEHLSNCRASAVILSQEAAQEFSGNKLITANPYAVYACLSALFDPRPVMAAGIHPAAVVAGSASVHREASIGPGAVIGEGVKIGAGSEIGANSWVGDRAVIGAGARVAANVSVYHDIVIGDNVTLHSGAVIGADGFGFANEKGRWIKIHQLGGVRIGDNVEIGACATVDRGAVGDTVLGNGVILDDHVHIGHNARVGENTAMAAFVGISGSTAIGKNCTFAGQAGVVGHITICDGVHIGARTVVSKSVTEPGSYTSGTSIAKTSLWRKNAARFNQLNEMARRIRALEKQLSK